MVCERTPHSIVGSSLSQVAVSCAGGGRMGSVSLGRVSEKCSEEYGRPSARDTAGIPSLQALEQCPRDMTRPMPVHRPYSP